LCSCCSNQYGKFRIDLTEFVVENNFAVFTILNDLSEYTEPSQNKVTI
jgi:hypothetical protein